MEEEKKEEVTQTEKTLSEKIKETVESKIENY